ncbi:MAG TPA: YHYH protein [Urbifossiella sp.]|nr:YHYH protein [Urbifossiella sp.]
MKPIALSVLTAAALGVVVLLSRPPEAVPAEQPAGDPLPVPRMSVTTKDGYRFISSNGIPDHETGSFPHRRCPNAMSEQRHEFRVPLSPSPAAATTPLRMHDFGVGVNGIPFDPFAAEWWERDRSSGWQYDPMSNAINLGLDAGNAHVQPTGAYHYHGLPRLLMAKLGGTAGKMLLVGWAADGFPMYAETGHKTAADAKSPVVVLKSSYRLKPTDRPTGPGGPHDGSFEQDYEYAAGLGDLDECNGRTGVTPEFPGGTYYYVVTAAYPYIPRHYRGTPDPSFFRRPPKKKP